MTGLHWRPDPPWSTRHGFRTQLPYARTDASCRRLHAGARLPGRGRIRGVRAGSGAALGRPAHRRRAQGQGARGRALEPVPAPRIPALEPGPDQSRIRTACGTDGTRRLGLDCLQLRGPRHRQHGGAGALRQRGPAGAVAHPVAGRVHPLGLPDDRARGGFLRRDQHRVLDRPRRRRLRRHRSQMVVEQHLSPGLRDPDRHGQDPLRRAEARAAIHDSRAAPCAWRAPRASAQGVRRSALTERSRRSRARGRARAGLQSAARRRPGFRDRTGPAGPRPHPSLHAPYWRRAAGARTDVPASGFTHGVRAQAERTGQPA